MTPNADERGNSLLEFMLVLPIIVLMLVGTVEFSRIFRVREVMSLIAREAANEAFRECFELQNVPCSGATESATDGCLDLRVQTIMDRIGNSFPNGVLTISMYRWDRITSTVDLIGFATSAGGPPENATKYSDVNDPGHLGVADHPRLRPLIERNTVLFIAEVYGGFPFFFQDAPTYQVMNDMDVGTKPLGFDFAVELYDLAIY